MSRASSMEYLNGCEKCGLYVVAETGSDADVVADDVDGAGDAGDVVAMAAVMVEEGDEEVEAAIVAEVELPVEGV